MISKVFLTLIVCICFLVIPIALFGQPSLPSAPSQAPIDGGLGILAAAGGAYAYKKLKGRRKE